jgi:hypothetical protein
MPLKSLKNYVIPVSTSRAEDFSSICDQTLSFLENYSHIARSRRYFSMREYADLFLRLNVTLESINPPLNSITAPEIEYYRNTFAYLKSKTFSTHPDTNSPFCQYLDFCSMFFDAWYAEVEENQQSF